MGMENKFFLVFALGVAVLNIIGCSDTMTESEANKIIKAFYNDNVPESIKDRHLLKAGKAIVPFLIIEIQKKEMPKRGYAILSLGKISDRRALPVLKQILSDTSESETIRGDALSAIWKIDKSLGKDMSEKHAGENEYMDRTIDLLKKGLI